MKNFVKDYTYNLNFPPNFPFSPPLLFFLRTVTSPPRPNPRDATHRPPNAAHTERDEGELRPPGVQRYAGLRPDSQPQGPGARHGLRRRA